MGFNYLQTDDRDDYFNSISKRKKKKCKRYALKRGEFESKWLQKWGMEKIIREETNFSKSELKKMSITEIKNVLINLDYQIHEEKL